MIHINDFNAELSKQRVVANKLNHWLDNNFNMERSYRAMMEMCQIELGFLDISMSLWYDIFWRLWNEHRGYIHPFGELLKAMHNKLQVMHSIERNGRCKIFTKGVHEMFALGKVEIDPQLFRFAILYNEGQLVKNIDMDAVRYSLEIMIRRAMGHPEDIMKSLPKGYRREM